MSKRYGEFESINGGIANCLMNKVDILEEEAREQRREIKRLTRELERSNR